MTDEATADIMTRHPFIIHTGDVTNDVTNWWRDIALRTLSILIDVLLLKGEQAAGQNQIYMYTHTGYLF